MAIVGIMALGFNLYMGYTHPSPPTKPDPRLEQIDSQIEKLQEERDEIDPPDDGYYDDRYGGA
jgi:hypothetical protein